MPEMPSANAQLPFEIDDRIDPTLVAPQLVETLIALWVAGGDRCQDLQMLRADAALATLLGYELLATTTMRDFLEAFHVEAPPLWRTGKKTAVPEESAPLASVGAANRHLLATVQQQAPQHTARLDVDATILETYKRTAAVTYTGPRGYQPVVVSGLSRT